MRRIRRKSLLGMLAGAVVALCLFIVAAPGTATAAAPLRYSGTATVTWDNYAYCGLGATRRYINTKRVSFPVVLNVSDRGRLDPNPFALSMISSPSYGNGAFSVLSTYSSTNLTLVYWSLAYNSANGALSGTLRNSWRSAGAAQNLLLTETPIIPCNFSVGGVVQAAAIREGAALSGSVTTRAARLTVSGLTTDLLRAFRIDVSANRVG